jgi:hypothetical protein
MSQKNKARKMRRTRLIRTAFGGGRLVECDTVAHRAFGVYAVVLFFKCSARALLPKKMAWLILYFFPLAQAFFRAR